MIKLAIYTREFSVLSLKVPRKFWRLHGVIGESSITGSAQETGG